MATLYTGMRDRLLVVSRTSDVDGWQVKARLTDHDLECVAAAPAAPERAFCGTFGDGLYRTTDGGDAFERVGEDALEPKVMSATVSPHDPDEVWVGTEPSRVYRSTDGGDTWAERPGLTDLPSADEWYFPPRPDTHHVRWLEIDPHDPERLYVGIEAGAFVLSEDAGRTWQERPPGSRRDNHSLATHPNAPGRVYSAAGDGYAESRDGGRSWDHPQEGLDHRYCWSVQPAPGDPDTVVMSAASGAYSAHRADSADTYLYRREGDGPWERVADGIPTGQGVIRAVIDVLDASGTGNGGGCAAGGVDEFYAVNNRGIYRSLDGGRTWDALDVEWPDALEDQTPRGLAVV